ncbi:hypothetical protein Poly24_48140 [Rosistilla carotiformis]|uniref:Uncharacterized protein n=1 Tax=Rosistilla carotiformis TaxID=2528017 RepID=A0A518JZV8_9BACT|nr:hypothetical protein [Rosistilla carotiformis]QDV71081.1 hypothetical protein Poly24_48140 [Rosistilla carotiformis]
MPVHTFKHAARNCCLLVAVVTSTAGAAGPFRMLIQEAPKTNAPAKVGTDNTVDENKTAAEKAAEAREQAQRNRNVRELAGDSIFGEHRVPTLVGNELKLPSLVAPTTQQREIGNGQTPKDNANLVMTSVIPLPEGIDRDGHWTYAKYDWVAANTFSHPLYFQDAMLERNGHELKCGLQPALSAARFFTTLPALPYLMTVQRPCECNHTLGYYRPGSRAPNLLQRPPYQRDAVLNQAAWTTGAILVIP